MVSFLFYDIIFLVLFTLSVVFFLYKRRKKIRREGIVFIYPTKVGIKLMDYISQKYSRVLGFFKYVVISSGFILMGIMLYLIGQTVYIYIITPQIIEVIKAPPIAPLIPYFPKLFGLESYFPDFYFIYFLVALAIVAVSHEFSHGIYMRLYNVRIKSTGFAFLGPFLGAFVEQDDKQMNKIEKSKQMAILGAGVFANLLITILFYLIFVGFFYISFSPSGYIFNSYSYAVINSSEISEMRAYGNLTELISGNSSYFLDDTLRQQLSLNQTLLLVYDDSPALRAELKGIIVQINDVKIKNQESLSSFLMNTSPGDNISVVTLIDDEKNTFNITLGKHPLNNSNSYLGISALSPVRRSFTQNFIYFFMQFRDSSTYYYPSFNPDLVYFIYYLLFWIILINLLVALFNMLPLGILDGGRFFYLAVHSVTKSERAAKLFYKVLSSILFAGFILMMIIWVLRVF